MFDFCGKVTQKTKRFFLGTLSMKIFLFSDGKYTGCLEIAFGESVGETKKMGNGGAWYFFP